MFIYFGPGKCLLPHKQGSSIAKQPVLYVRCCPVYVPNSASCGRHRMSTDSVFSIAPASLSLGAVLSRGSPGITVYKAELLVGQRTLQVQHLKSCQHTFYTVSCNGF